MNSDKLLYYMKIYVNYTEIYLNSKSSLEGIAFIDRDSTNNFIPFNFEGSISNFKLDFSNINKNEDIVLFLLFKMPKSISNKKLNSSRILQNSSYSFKFYISNSELDDSFNFPVFNFEEFYQNIIYGGVGLFAFITILILICCCCCRKKRKKKRKLKRRSKNIVNYQKRALAPKRAKTLGGPKNVGENQRRNTQPNFQRVNSSNKQYTKPIPLTFHLNQANTPKVQNDTNRNHQKNFRNNNQYRNSTPDRPININSPYNVQRKPTKQNNTVGIDTLNRQQTTPNSNQNFYPRTPNSVNVNNNNPNFQRNPPMNNFYNNNPFNPSSNQQGPVPNYPMTIPNLPNQGPPLNNQPFRRPSNYQGTPFNNNMQNNQGGLNHNIDELPLYKVDTNKAPNYDAKQK